jgi:hypothetical protein
VADVRGGVGLAVDQLAFQAAVGRYDDLVKLEAKFCNSEAILFVFGLSSYLILAFSLQICVGIQQHSETAVVATPLRFGEPSAVVTPVVVIVVHDCSWLRLSLRHPVVVDVVSNLLHGRTWIGPVGSGSSQQMYHQYRLC